MKSKIYLGLVCLIMVIPALFLNNCGNGSDNRIKRDREMEKMLVEKIAEKMRKHLPNLKFEFKPENCIVEKIKNNRRRITFKNYNVKTDLHRVSEALFNDAIPRNLGGEFLLDAKSTEWMSRLEGAQFDKLSFIIGLDDGYFKFLGVEGGRMDYKSPVLSGQNGTTTTGNKPSISFRSSLGKGTFGGTGANFLDQILLEDIKVEFQRGVGTEDQLDVSLQIEKIEWVTEDSEDPYILEYIKGKNAPPPDLARARQKGLTIDAFHFNIGRVNLMVKKNGSNFCSSTIGGVSISYHIKPDRDGQYFNMVQEFKINDVITLLPGMPIFQPLANFKNIQGGVKLEKINDSAALFFIDQVKTGVHSSELVLNSSEVGTNLPGIAGLLKLVASNPNVKLFLCPIKHYFGELCVTADFKPTNGLVTPPLMSIKMDIQNLDNMLVKLNASGLIPHSTMQKISQFVKIAMVRKENGGASFIAETKSGHPGILFLNGIPYKIPPMNPMMQLGMPGMAR